MHSAIGYQPLAGVTVR